MSKKNPLEPPQLEQALVELEQIVKRLEHGGSSLDEDLEGYSRAIELIKVCQGRLAKAERTIVQLSGVKPDGTPVTEPFEESSQNLEQKQADRSRRRSANKDDSLF